MNDATKLLDQTLAEGKKTDEALTELAIDRINPRALQVSEAGRRQAGAAK